LLDCRDRRIAQNEFSQFIGHTGSSLQRSFRGVHGLIESTTFSKRAGATLLAIRRVESLD
jgi:hypothetical protein